MDNCNKPLTVMLNPWRDQSLKNMGKLLKPHDHRVSYVRKSCYFLVLVIGCLVSFLLMISVLVDSYIADVPVEAASIDMTR